MTDYSRIFDLSGRTALVIGGASGIGRESCFGLASFGARVICGDIEIAKAKEVAQALAAEGRTADALHVDLCSAASVAAAAKSVGAPDVLLISPSINVRKPVLDIAEEEFDRVVELNLKGVFRALKAFAPGMAKRGKGSIIAFSSIRAQVVEPGQGVYAATKAGTLQMIRALAAELARRAFAPTSSRRASSRRRSPARSRRTRPGTAPMRTSRSCGDGRARPSSSARWSTSPPTRARTSPDHISWSTAAGPRSTAASRRRLAPADGSKFLKKHDWLVIAGVHHAGDGIGGIGGSSTRKCRFRT